MYELIKKFEGCSLTAYQCEAGVWTIGWGSTFYPSGQPVKKDDKITQAEADSLLAWHAKKISLPDGINSAQKQALLSLVYNIGQNAFDKSTLKKAIISKDWKLVYKNWDWVTAGGKFSRGLAIRRAKELEVFFSEPL